VAPWTVWWRRNLFADLLPWLQALMALPAARIVVVATGVVTVLAGLRDVRDLLVRRLARSPGLPNARPPEL
jgi:hypothetical protein